LGSENPAQLWQLYVLLTQIEEAFKNHSCPRHLLKKS
jgi:hypothetical protein